jgi:hypothetical protein
MNEQPESDVYDEFAETIDALVEDRIPPVGAVIAYAGHTLPEGWLECDGRAIPRQEYPQLFRAISTAFGEGDGQSTFNIPNVPPLTRDIRYIIRAGT